MTLKDILQRCLNELEWKDAIEHDESDDTDYVSTGYLIDGQSYRLVLVTSEKDQILRIMLVSPLRIPKSRIREAALVLNFLNSRMSVGNLEIDATDMLYYRWAIDVEGASAAPAQFKTMIGAATAAFDERRCTAIGAAVFSVMPAEDIIESYVQEAENLRVPRFVS